MDNFAIYIYINFSIVQQYIYSVFLHCSQIASLDLDDIIYCGSFWNGNGQAFYSVQEEPLYDPSLHHVAPLTLIHLKAVTEDGQFEDAVD